MAPQNLSKNRIHFGICVPSEWYRNDIGLFFFVKNSRNCLQKNIFVTVGRGEFRQMCDMVLLDFWGRWGRVFKIHDFFRHDFIGCLLSVSSMVKWVTPLGVR